MGDKWREGVFSEEKLKETLHLLPWINEDTSLEKCNEDSLTNPSSSTNYNHYLTSINSKTVKELDKANCIKERHISIDSARDSGIGENSNFTDIDTLKFDEENGENKNLEESESLEPNISNVTDSESIEAVQSNESSEVMKGYWQPKQKRSITERLPEKSFYLIHPSRYIFPGAELYIDPDEKVNYFDNSSSDSSDSDSETETENVDSSF